MIILLKILVIGMGVYIIKALIDINSLVLKITKDNEVAKIPNELEKIINL